MKCENDCGKDAETLVSFPGSGSIVLCPSCAQAAISGGAVELFLPNHLVAEHDVPRDLAFTLSETGLAFLHVGAHDSERKEV